MSQRTYEKHQLHKMGTIVSFLGITKNFSNTSQLEDLLFEFSGSARWPLPCRDSSQPGLCGTRSEPATSVPLWDQSSAQASPGARRAHAPRATNARKGGPEPAHPRVP